MYHETEAYLYIHHLSATFYRFYLQIIIFEHRLEIIILGLIGVIANCERKIKNMAVMLT